MEGCAFRAYIPALNGEVLRASPIKKPLHCSGFFIVILRVRLNTLIVKRLNPY